MISSSTVWKHPGEPCVSNSIAHAFVKDAPELTWFRTEQAALECIRNSIECDGRYELTVWIGGNPVGVAIAVPEYDEHVGQCLSVQWRFVLPEHRGAAGAVLHRKLIKLAHILNAPVLAYTRRIGLGMYQLKYTKVRKP